MGHHFSVGVGVAGAQQPVDHLSNLQDFKSALEKKSKGEFSQSLYHFIKAKEILEHSHQQKSPEYIRVLRQFDNEDYTGELRDSKLWGKRIDAAENFGHPVRNSR